MADHTLLPQLQGDVFLTDGGVETDLIFRRGIDLPEFASFVLHDSSESESVVREYFEDYLRISSETGLGLVLETLTWRASSDWGTALGYDRAGLHDANRRAAEFLLQLCEVHDSAPLVVSGCVGPRDDAYSELATMTADDAAEYHQVQIATLVDSGVELITALTLTNTEEAIGITRAAGSSGSPVVISFTVETDGRLPTGPTVAEAIRAVDDATDGAPAYYMVNCAHHDHLTDAVSASDVAIDRIRGVRANASRLSHAELDERDDLDDGDPAEFGRQLVALSRGPGRIDVLGGCCGTDSRHLGALAAELRA